MVPEREVVPIQNIGENPILDEGWWKSVIEDDAKILEETEIHPQNNHLNESTGYFHVDWTGVQKLFENDEVIQLKVYGYNRGGVLVEGDGIQGFVPVSHLVDFCDAECEEKRKESLAHYSGTNLRLKVIECQPSADRIVLSERAALAGDGSRKHLFKTLKVGDRVNGAVTNVTEFGVFVDLGGVEGLIHVSELSWGRVQHPGEVLKVGEKIETIVLQVCEDNSRVALSLKRLLSNPWESLCKKYHAGDVVDAVVTSIMRFGAFARLEEGIEGLIHKSSMSFPAGVSGIEGLLSKGQSIKVEILHIDKDRRRLGLALFSDLSGNELD